MADGGNLTGIEQAAIVGFAGLDPLRFLYTRDDLERNMIVELTNRIMQMRDIEQKNLAVRIAEQVGNLFSK